MKLWAAINLEFLLRLVVLAGEFGFPACWTKEAFSVTTPNSNSSNKTKETNKKYENDLFRWQQRMQHKWVIYWILHAFVVSLFPNVFPIQAAFVLWALLLQHAMQHEKNKIYVIVCQVQLYREFWFLSEAGAGYYAKRYKSYTKSHRVICNALMGRRKYSLFARTTWTSSQDHVEFANILTTVMMPKGDVEPLLLTNEQHERLSTHRRGAWTTLIYRRSTQHFQENPWISCDSPTIASEVLECRNRLQLWLTEVDLTRPRSECQCCFEISLVSEMVSCQDGNHLFCQSCVAKHVSHRVFDSANFGVDPNGDLNLEVKCMSGDGCNSRFSGLEKVVSPLVLEKYEERQFMLSLQVADVRDLGKCPRCPYLAILDPEAIFFACPACEHTTCRKCGEAAHPKESCRAKQSTKTRISREEVKTQILIRTCPNLICRKELIKSTGCNKVRCSCGTLICYVCRQRIVGYKHFCQEPHCRHGTCNKCTLWGSTNKRDARAIARAESKEQRTTKIGKKKR